MSERFVKNIVHFTYVLTVSEVHVKFLKCAMNLAISLRSFQLNRELGNEVVKFMPNFNGKLRSSL